MYLGIFDSIGQWLMNLVRSLFFIIDRIVYSFIVTVYNLLVDIATTEIFTETIFQEFADRIYAILGIFMLFKVSFNVINYIINPDEFLDKNKGFGKVITSIIISLTLLVGTPWIFKTALSLQQEILDQGIINRIVFGEDGKIPVTDPGNTMATTTFEAFCNTDVNGYEMQGDKIVDRIDSIDINQKVNDKYVWNYTFIISTLAGGAIVLLLVVMCFDIAVRNVKFAFLRILAPVPIVSRIDPKGKGVFDKWVKACTNTYLDLFIRLLGINLAVFIISKLDEMNIGDKFFVKVFIIFGVLLFAKQLPNLISDLFGVKLDGKFTMNPLKKLSEVPMVGKPLESTARFAGRSAAALGGVGAAFLGRGVSKVGKGIDNLTGNRISGLSNTISSGYRDWKREKDEEFRRNTPNLARATTRIKMDADKTFSQMIGGVVNLGKEADKLDAKIKKLETYASFKGTLEAQADFYSQDMSKDAKLSAATSGFKELEDASKDGVKGLKQFYEDLKLSGTATASQITQARKAWETAREIAIDTGATEGIAIIKEQASRYVRENRDVFDSNNYSDSSTATYKEIKDGVVAAQNEVTKTKASDEYENAQRKKASAPPKKNK